MTLLCGLDGKVGGWKQGVVGRMPHPCSMLFNETRLALWKREEVDAYTQTHAHKYTQTQNIHINTQKNTHINTHKHTHIRQVVYSLM